MKLIHLVVIFAITVSMMACTGSTSAPTSVTPPTGASGGSSTTFSGCDTLGIVWGGTTGGVSSTASGFVEVGPMSMPRAGHTATLLPNKTILVIDGGQLDVDDLLVSIPSAEIFDPSRGTFAPTGSPCKAREFHTATLLTNGKVLITGGNEFNGYPTWLTPTSTAELYDPASGSFTTTGSMAVGRSGHTASLLLDGRVLIVGGSPKGAPTAEIYDPAAGTFSVVPGITEERVGHTATVLVSGKVLIAGGQATQPSGTTAIATAEVYDPALNTFTAVNSMNSQRTGHTATLLSDGRVLIAGGSSSGALATGGLIGSGLLQTSELYDPSTGTFAAAASMSTSRLGHTATLLPDGRVLICGGLNASTAATGYQSYNSAEIFDPKTGSFTVGGQMNVGRFWHSATLLPNGSVLVAGGVGGDQALSSAEIF
jgi:hypothetical protein